MLKHDNSLLMIGKHGHREYARSHHKHCNNSLCHALVGALAYQHPNQVVAHWPIGNARWDPWLLQFDHAHRGVLMVSSVAVCAYFSSAFQ